MQKCYKPLPQQWLPRYLLLLLPVLSGCATAPCAQVVATSPPLPPVPALLMQSPPKPLQTASLLQSLLFEPATPQTPANASSTLK